MLDLVRFRTEKCLSVPVPCIRPRSCAGRTAVIALLVSCLALTAQGSSPTDIISEAMEDLLDSVESIYATEADPTRATRRAVAKVLAPHFDFHRTSHWVLGKPWRSATPLQQEKFVHEFKTLLITTYAGAVAKFAGLEVSYLPVEMLTNSDEVIVPVEVPSQKGNPPVLIQYRMRIHEQDWKVYDVIVGGVSLVTTYRTTFRSEIQQNGLDALIEKLAVRNQASNDP